MISAFNYTDFLYRARRPEELETARGGGVIYSQAAHQIDVVRLLAQAELSTVRAFTGSWDNSRATEGAYTALLGFADGSFANVTYSGYAHFDSDELAGWTDELGHKKNPDAYGDARRSLHGLSPREEARLKERKVYGSSLSGSDDIAPHHQHFGFLLASCERADLRPLPTGVMIYGDTTRHLENLPPPKVPRSGVIDEAYFAIRNGQTPLHDGKWGRATMEVCNAILESANTGREIELKYQVIPNA